jgi:hypothetical protein
VAEREGFEPSIRFWRILTFQASAFDHSATAPHALDGKAPLGARGSQGKLGAKPSIRRAKAMSLPVTPPSLWVDSRTETLFQLFDQSG